MIEDVQTPTTAETTERASCKTPGCACGPECRCGDACVCTPASNCAD